MPADDLDRALVRDRLAAAVREAGALALHMFRGRPASWIKGASSPVSEADLAVDALLRERLLTVRDAGWLSEETEDDPARLQRAEVWVVDPIDGTRAYLAGLADWVIAAALVRAGRRWDRPPTPRRAATAPDRPPFPPTASRRHGR